MEFDSNNRVTKSATGSQYLTIQNTDTNTHDGLWIQVRGTSNQAK